MNISNYDNFFIDLEKRLQQCPSNRRSILLKAVKDTNCPYLIGKLQEIKRIYKVTLFLLVLALANMVNAQSGFFIVDSETRQPLLGASVAVQSADKSALLITDEAGRFELTFEELCSVYITHIGYEPLSLELQRDSSATYFLTPSSQALDQVVVTGQFEPQSASNSVYKIKTITSERLEAQSANTLQDVLANELNMTFSRDNATGSSGLTLQGLSGQYVKVLLDGIPITGRSGVDNGVDLSQINVQSIDRIEIVEGPLSVSFGADALAGVINIITKKRSELISLDVQLQEETVEQEYSWLDDGIHNASVLLGAGLASKWYVQGDLRWNRFGGWIGNGDERNKQWYPKDQLFAGGLVSYTGTKLSVQYRMDYLDEELANLGTVDDANPIKDPSALDEQYLTHRLMHQLQANWDLSSWKVNSVFSYTDYERRTEQFTINLATGDEELTSPDEQDTLFYQSFFQRQTLTNSIPISLGEIRLNIQGGVDTEVQTGGGTKLNGGDKHQTDLGFFTSLELDWHRLKIRPGLRLTHNSQFSSSPTPSVNLKYQITDKLLLRLGYGRGYRAPSIREMYYEFIDANHNIIGNEDLKAEYSHNVNADIRLGQSSFFTLDVGGFYNHIDNQITYFTPTESNQPTTYVNLLKFKTTGGKVEGSWSSSMIRVQTGVSYIGQYQRLNESEDVPLFVFSPNANINVQWDVIRGWKVYSFYRFVGSNKTYQLQEMDNGESSPELAKVDAYHFWDVNLSKQINSLNISAGVRNLLDVTSVNNNLTSGGAHGGGAGSTSVAYGRSWFLRLNYKYIKQYNK